MSRQGENGQVGPLLIGRNDPAKPYGIDEELAELNSDDVDCSVNLSVVADVLAKSCGECPVQALQGNRLATVGR